MSLIEVRDLSYSFPESQGSRKALSDVSLAINSGERVAILGANGSGKTTLARCMCALYSPTSGEIIVDGRAVSDRESLRFARSRVGLVFQNPEEQIIAPIVRDEVAFGPESLGLSRARVEFAVDSSLAAMDLSALGDRSTDSLSMGQTQKLAIAGILAMDPACLIFDESSSMLDPRSRGALVSLQDSLVARGIAVVLVTHRMEEAARADRAIVLSEGRLVADEAPLSLFGREELGSWGLDLPRAFALAKQFASAWSPPSPLEEQIIQGLAESIGDKGGLKNFDVLATESKPARWAFGNVILRAEGLRLEYRERETIVVALDGARIELREGECVAVVGESGAGKSSLFDAIDALIEPQAGTVLAFGIPMSERLQPDSTRKGKRHRGGVDKIKSPTTIARLSIAYAFQEPEKQFFERYVGDEIAYGARNAGLVGDALRERVRVSMERCGLEFLAFKDRSLWSLSGGERRRVALAAAIAQGPRLLLLDEPTAGLDPKHRAELIVTLKAMVAQGLSLIVSTHDMEEANELADRVVVMGSGKTIADGKVGAIFANAGLLSAAGLEAPAIYKLRSALLAREAS